MELVAARAREKSYPATEGPVEVLRPLDLSIQQGECVTLLGPSGCGKSTLLQVIAGLMEDAAGPEHGMVFQDDRLLPWVTVLDNVRIALADAPLSAREKTDQALSHLALVGLEGFEEAYPGQLSGGMAQRVAIARALVNRPRILLLDEPFARLDALTRAHLQSELARICHQENITMIFVTRDVDEAIYLGDRVAVMARGQGRITQFPVEIDRPRRRTDPAFNSLKERILSVLERDTWT